MVRRKSTTAEQAPVRDTATPNAAPHPAPPHPAPPHPAPPDTAAPDTAAPDTPWAGPLRATTTIRCAVALRDQGQATISQLAERTELSRPTAQAALTALTDRGLVAESDTRTSGGRGAGRPARRYEFVATTGYMLGVDIGSRSARFGLVDLSGQLHALHETALARDAEGERRLQAVTNGIRRFLADNDTAPGALVAASLAVPGLVREDGHIVTSHIMPDWSGTNLAQHCERELGCPVSVDNDMRLASLAEHRLGAARSADDVICLFAGRRLSMGLLLDGRVRRGHHGAAGEVGDLLFTDHVDATGELRWTSGETAADVFHKAGRGDRDATAEIESFAREIATGLATLALGIDPELIVVGGGISQAGEALLTPLREAMSAAITVPVRPRVVASTLGTEAVVLGAVLRACAESTAVTGLPEPTLDLAHAHQLMERK